MPAASPSEITQLLQAWSDGNAGALEQLVPLVSAEMRRLARGYMRQEQAGHTLQASALINEVYLRLIDWRNVRWADRAHFFGVAARLMRRTLVDHARRKRYLKRRGAAMQMSIDDVAVVSRERSADLVAIDDALKSLAAFDARKSRIVELRFFGGLTVEETAEVLKVSPRTVKREWNLARSWLYCQLAPEMAADPRSSPH